MFDLRLVKERLTPVQWLSLALTVTGLGLAISRLFVDGWPALPVALTAVFLVASIVVFAVARRRPYLSVFENADDKSAKRHQVMEILRYVSTPGSELVVIARTAFRWLCGDENNVNRDAESEELRKTIAAAVRAGCTIHFVLQALHVELPRISEDERSKNAEHRDLALASLAKLASMLSADEQGRLQVSFVDDPIEHSMVRICKDNQTVRMIIGLGFKFKEPSPGRISKPFLVFESPRRSAETFEEFNRDFKYLEKKCQSQRDFEAGVKSSLDRITALVAKHDHPYPLRNNTSKNIVRATARAFIASEQKPDVPPADVPPPVSVQVLVTDRCTTPGCKMCRDRGNAHHGHDELSLAELNDLFRQICELGTKNVVLSGGEPFAREDIFLLLAGAKEAGLAVGLMTNGVKSSEGNQYAPWTESDTDAVVRNCDWVQIGIDSFDASTYADIRGANCLSSVLKSTALLADAAARKGQRPLIEACMAIQAANLQEAVDLAQGRVAPKGLPPGVTLRFKPAHALGGGNAYLCTSKDKDKLGKLADPYMTKMLSSRRFDLDNIVEGRPLSKWLDRTWGQGYTCWAVRLSCMIDPLGQVYPCPYLYCDNKRSEPTRSRYQVGKLRGADGNGMIDRAVTLAKLWRDPAFESWRKKELPISETSCNCCTRFFLQNELANQLAKEFSRSLQYLTAALLNRDALDPKSYIDRLAKESLDKLDAGRPFPAFWL